MGGHQPGTPLHGGFLAIALLPTNLSAAPFTPNHTAYELGIDPAPSVRMSGRRRRRLRDMRWSPLGGTRKPASPGARTDFDIVGRFRSVSRPFLPALAMTDARLTDGIPRATGRWRDGGAAKGLPQSQPGADAGEHPAFIHGGPFANIAHGCNSWWRPAAR